MNLELDTLLLIVAAIAVGSFVKGATGAGLPLVAIPVMSTFVGVEAAVVIMAIPGIVSNTWMLWSYWPHYKDTRDLPVLLVTGVIGAVIGTALLNALDEDILSFVVAAMIVLYAILFFSHPDFRLPQDVTRISSPPVGFASGLLQGATGISGPLIATYLHGFRLKREAFVLSVITVFQVFAIAQALTLLSVGLYNRDRLVASLLALIPMMTMLPLGARLAERLSRRTFDLVVLALLLASATKLVFDALS